MCACVCVYISVYIAGQTVKHCYPYRNSSPLDIRRAANAIQNNFMRLNCVYIQNVITIIKHIAFKKPFS